MYKWLKRVLDLLGASILLILLSPLFLLIALIVRIKLGSPVFFYHERPGLGTAPFKMIKFRTMLNTRDDQGNLLPDAERISAFGTKLRSLSFDEFPELINVLRGEMSFVGPRPLMTRYLPYYTANEQQRHSVRPGITGLAQVNGRNAISWEEIFKHDLYYVNHLSLALDLSILIKTFTVVFARKGITDSARALGREPLDKFRNPAENTE